MTTEGIIQKVLNKHKIDLSQFIMLWRMSPQEYNQELEFIIQELIAEIKKELNVTDSRLPVWYNQLMRHKLIGDNQE